MSWFQKREEEDKKKRELDFFRALYGLFGLPEHQFLTMKSLAADIHDDFYKRSQPIISSLGRIYQIGPDLLMTKENEPRYKEFNLSRAGFESDVRRAVSLINSAQKYSELREAKNRELLTLAESILRKILEDARKYSPEE